MTAVVVVRLVVHLFRSKWSYRQMNIQTHARSGGSTYIRGVKHTARDDFAKCRNETFTAIFTTCMYTFYTFTRQGDNLSLFLNSSHCSFYGGVSVQGIKITTQLWK